LIWLNRSDSVEDLEVEIAMGAARELSELGDEWSIIYL